MPTQPQAERACQQVYAHTLFAAAQDPARQTVAYREIHAYLYRVATRQRPEVAEDAAQEALLLIYQNIGTCRDPNAFLKFAIYQLMTAFHRLTPRRSELSLDEPMQASDEAQPLVEILPDSRSMETEVEEQAPRRTFCVGCGVLSRPIRGAQPTAGRGDEVSGRTRRRADRDRLETTVANVHVLRSRGLEKLRAEIKKLPPGARFISELHLEL